MSETLACPDCGHRNPPDRQSCERCFYPLVEGIEPGTLPMPSEPAAPGSGGPMAGDVTAMPSGPPEPPGPPATPDPATPDAATPGTGDAADAGTPLVIPRLRPIRPRRPGTQNNLVVSLWLGVGAFVALLLILVAVQANLERRDPTVEGSNRDQQATANAYRAALDRDSTDVPSRVGLADILFDTGNWSEAVIHYSSAVRHDSSQVTAIVDLGVCYYNLGVPAEAERLFRLALARDPHQPYALFNLGIVHERRGDLPAALKFFHSALQASPPENMKPAVLEALQRVAKASGREAPPLESTK